VSLADAPPMICLKTGGACSRDQKLDGSVQCLRVLLQRSAYCVPSAWPSARAALLVAIERAAELERKKEIITMEPMK
jgi:hypothetical protein